MHRLYYLFRRDILICVSLRKRAAIYLPTPNIISPSNTMEGLSVLPLNEFA